MNKTKRVKRARNIDRRKLTRLSRRCGITPKELYDLRSGKIIEVTERQALTLIQQHYAVPAEEVDVEEPKPEKKLEPVEEETITVDEPEHENMADDVSWFGDPDEPDNVDDDEDKEVL